VPERVPRPDGDPRIEPKPEELLKGPMTEIQQKALAALVANFVAKLGDTSFRTREDATLQLIAMGKGGGKCKATDLKRREIVMAGMRGCAKHKDPEVRERAKRVLLALTPPKKVARPPRQVEMIDGDIAVW
jgi:hypothetical protein